MPRPLNSKTPSFWEFLRQYPPLAIRLLARRGTAGVDIRSLSNTEIAISSGIPLSRVIEISAMLTPDDITIGEAERFCRACNFDPTNATHRERQYDYIRSCQRPESQSRCPKYLTCSPSWTTELLPLVQRLKSHQKSLGDSGRSASQPITCAA